MRSRSWRGKARRYGFGGRDAGGEAASRGSEAGGTGGE